MHYSTLLQWRRISRIFFSMNNFFMRQRSCGTTLVELIVYIAVLAVMATVIIGGIVQMSRVYGRVRLDRRVTAAAQTALERMVREIRLAKTVEIVDADTINLTTYADFNPDVETIIPTTTRQVTRTGTQVLLDNVPITESDVSVNSLTFFALDRSHSTAGSQAVRIEMAVEAGSGDYKVSRVYSALAVLRNSY